MKRQDFQHGEIRDADDNIISAGTYGKKTAFVNSTNDGILDYIINNFEYLNDRVDESGTGGTITIDDELSTTSTNAVTNKAITNGINSVSTALSDFEDVVVDTYAKSADVYTKTEVNTSLNTKADKTDIYTKEEVDAKVASVYKYKGSVSTYDKLPTTSLVVGDVYNIDDTGANYAWTGESWDKLSETIDLTQYAVKANLATVATSGSYNDLTNKPTVNQVYQSLSTSTGKLYPLLSSNTSTTTANTYKSSKFTVQPSTGNITCGTVNGVDVTSLAKSSDITDCIADITQQDGGFVYTTKAGVSGNIETNTVNQVDWSSYSDSAPIALATWGGKNGTIAYTSSAKIQANTGNITCGTVNGVDVTTLAKSSDMPIRSTSTITLASTSWSDSKYTISNTSITADSTILFDVPVGTTSDNLNAIQKAKIVASSQTSGTLVLQAMGTVPTIDTSITLVVMN